VLSPTERDSAKVLTSLPPMVPAAARTWTGVGSPLQDGERPGIHSPPRHRMPFYLKNRANIACHVIRCHLTQETSVQMRWISRQSLSARPWDRGTHQLGDFTTGHGNLDSLARHEMSYAAADDMVEGEMSTNFYPFFFYNHIEGFYDLFYGDKTEVDPVIQLCIIGISPAVGPETGRAWLILLVAS